MDRRSVVLAGAGMFCAFAVRAQQADTKRVAMLIPFAESDAQAQTQLTAFRDELRRLGWSEGRNLRTEVRWAKGDIGLIRIFAKELAASAPDLIVARTTPVTAALLKETRSVPIVFVVVSDPLGDGFVSNLGRPGGNVSGFTNVESSLGGKWLELLKQIKPNLERVAVLYGPKTAPGGGTYYLRIIQAAGQAMSVGVVATPIDGPAQIEHAIGELGKDRGMGLIVAPDVTTATHRKLIIQLAPRHQLTAVYSASYFADDGGLVAYGIDYVDLYRRAASYADRILRGAKVGDLPVQGPTKFELAVNLNAAKALGIRIPESLLVRADRVIQ